jgi:glycerol-3-phosphate dehydrogenase
LVERYGDDWESAIDQIRAQPVLAEPIVPGLPVLRVEGEMARLREMAITDDDVLIRRTRLATMDARAAAALSG